jgi:hypothetical protein
VQLGALFIAVLTGFDESISFAQSCGVDENDNLLFWSGEIAHGKTIVIPSRGERI